MPDANWNITVSSTINNKLDIININSLVKLSSSLNAVLNIINNVKKDKKIMAINR